MAGTFEMNFYYLFQIDTTPEGAARTWVRLARGISSITPNNNENKDQTAYLDGNGWASSDVIGKQRTYDVVGHRVVGDVAQDYIASKELALGDDCKTNFQAFDSRGRKISGAVTINAVVIGGGDAQGKVDFACSLDLNGEPELVVESAAAALTATVAAAVVTVGCTTFTATAEEGNTHAYKLTAATQTAYANGYPGLLTAYTTGADIPATAGQYLGMYELDKNKRVVKFAVELLEAADIKAAT